MLGLRNALNDKQFSKSLRGVEIDSSLLGLHTKLDGESSERVLMEPPRRIIEPSRLEETFKITQSYPALPVIPLNH